jgi:hypothetical protein
VRVAEQVSIERPPAAVVELLGQRPATWLQPFLLLAWNEGEAALRRLGCGAGSVATATVAMTDHQLRLSEPVSRNGTTSFGVVWTAGAAALLFRRLRGELVVEPFERGTVLGLRATCVSQGEPELLGTAQRPVELVVRSLLGHIRTALE